MPFGSSSVPEHPVDNQGNSRSVAPSEAMERSDKAGMITVSFTARERTRADH